MTKAAIYRRISRDREGRELGVERQEVDCRELAGQLGAEVVEVLTDNDLSASTRSRKARPGYERLLTGAREGRWSLILAWSSSRLTRRPLELEGQIQLAEQHGTRFAYCKSPSFDLNTAAGRAIARTMAAWDAAEAEQTAERLAAQKRQAAASGQWRGGRRPYGYEADGVTLIPAEAATVAWAAREVLLGASLRSLAAELNAQGATTSTGNRWTATELRRVLLRPRNAGLIEAHGEVVGEACWPAILARPQWEAACRVLTDPARQTNHSGNARRWLGSRLYLCGVCGDGTTVRCTTSGRAGPYYCCVSGVKHLARRATYVDEVVEGAVLGWLSRPEVAEQLVSGEDVDTTALDLRARELRNRLDEAADMYAAGTWDRARCEKITRQVRAELNEVEEDLIRAAVGHPAAELVSATDIEAVWRELDVSRRQAIVDAIAVVTLTPARRGRPAGWRPGERYFDPQTVRVEWRTGE